MKPLNLDNSPCSPISSNCVVWQGPDISCLNLCTGDTISDVVAAMATELCTILDTLKVSNYDLTCFNLQACGPEDFQALIQFLITKICELEGIPATKIDTIDCPSCVVSVADCFVTGTQTTMELVDYVQLIGERICSIITDISLINSQITDILIRITALEEAPVPTFTVPSFTINCQIGSLLSGTTQNIDVLLEEFINNVWCGFYAVTGSATDLTNAIGTQEPCITETSSTISNSAITYGVAYPAWEADPSTVANSITNIWSVLCDLYTFLSSPQVITVGETNTVDLQLTEDNLLTAKMQDTGWIDLEGFSSWVSGAAASDGTMPQCRRIGNVIHFRGLAFIPLKQSSTSTPEPLSDLADYETIARVAPATSGPGSVLTDTAGSLKWNEGNSVIPTSVLAATETLDGAYRMPYPAVLSRVIAVSGGAGTMLSAAGRLGVLSTGVLYFATLKDQELPAGLGLIFRGASPLRYITSNIRSGESVPNYINPATDIHNLPAAGVNNLVAETDFSGSDYTWPFDLDAGEETDLGGFYASLEGLTAFVSCSSTAATATCYET
tara:strand:+ start:5807 stop:7474 length:1668 start_codon:yes stop_codon:yes gene_type:complete